MAEDLADLVARLFEIARRWDQWGVVVVFVAGWLFTLLRRWLKRPDAAIDDEAPIEPR
jgi:hypothetical protein